MRDGWLRTLSESGKKIGLGLLVVVAAMSAGAGLRAQTAEQAWLNYGLKSRVRMFFPANVRALGDSAEEHSAVEELNRSLDGLSTIERKSWEGQTVLGTVEEMRKEFPSIQIPDDLAPEGYWIYGNQRPGPQQRVLVAGADPRGVLYGAFALLRQPFDDDGSESGAERRGQPAMPIRWTDEWDNIDGSIERGYGGRSIFL